MFAEPDASVVGEMDGCSHTVFITSIIESSRSQEAVMDPIESTIVLAGGRIKCARCTARAKGSQAQCRKPAMRGKTKCRTHGGASTGPKTEAGKAAIRKAHLKHGEATLAARAESSAQSCKMQQLEDIMHVMNMTSATRTRGRKALGYVPIRTFEQAKAWIYLDLLKKAQAVESE